MPKVSQKIAGILIWPIRIYQTTISPDHGFGKVFFGPVAGCRYYPSCSKYFIDAIKAHGIFSGFCRGVYRVLRCHPWAKGGYDPVA